ncbi:MAG TPA: hypothetical protein VNW04_04820 [Puia sp.]|nr:hypothetical protein [Puia sp.]
MKIIARALAGLSNKLRVIESVVSLARDQQCPVEIIWAPDWQMVAQYGELFEPSELFSVTNRDKLKYCRSSFSLPGYKKPLAAVVNRVHGIDLVFNELDISRQVRPGRWDIRAMTAGKTIYIDTCHNFYPYHYNFSWIKPVPSIADKVAGFEEIIKDKHCIGLHIRRTDNASSIEHSPDRLFEEAIRKELEADPDTVFFLATDGKATQTHFITLFGHDRILAHPKQFGRDNVRAIQDAVVDWMLLARCRKLYCSFYSSFSETVTAVSKAPAVTLKTE